MTKQIIVDVNEETGEVKIETHGYSGKACTLESQWIKDLIGEEISQQLKPCYFMKEKEKTVIKRHLPICG